MCLCVCVFVWHHRWLSSWPLVDGSVRFNGALRPNYSSAVTYSATLLPWMSFVFGPSTSCVRPFLMHTLLCTHTQAQVLVCLKVLMEKSASARRDTPQSTTWHHGWNKTEGIVGPFVWMGIFELHERAVLNHNMNCSISSCFYCMFSWSQNTKRELGELRKDPLLCFLLCFLTIGFKMKHLTSLFYVFFLLGLDN